MLKVGMQRRTVTMPVCPAPRWMATAGTSSVKRVSWSSTSGTSSLATSAAAAMVLQPTSASVTAGTAVPGLNNSLDSGTLMPHKNAGGHGQTKQLWGSSAHVENISVAQAEKLYLGLTERTNNSDTLLVVYAPWCSHCRAIEKEVGKLAAGLSHAKDLQVVALNADSVEGRYFAKDVLGAQIFPTFITFPKGSRTFYTYQGKTRDAASLTRFLNMTCKQQDEQQLELGAKASSASVPEISMLATPASSSSPWSALLPAISTYGPLAAVLLGITLAATLFTFIMRSLLPSKVTAGTTPSTSSIQPTTAAVPVPRGLASEIDNSIGRMTSLALRLIQARFALLFGGNKQSVAAKKASVANDASVTPAAAAAIAAEVSSAAKAMATLEARSGSASTASSANSRAATVGATAHSAHLRPPSSAPATPPMRQLSVAPVSAAPASSLNHSTTIALPTQASSNGSSGSGSEGSVALQNLSADDLLAMLAAEGSVGKVVDRLMKKPAVAHR